MNTFHDAIQEQNLKTLSEEENKLLDKFLENFNLYKWQRDIIELPIANTTTNDGIQVIIPTTTNSRHYNWHIDNIL